MKVIIEYDEKGSMSKVCIMNNGSMQTMDVAKQQDDREHGRLIGTVLTDGKED